MIRKSSFIHIPVKFLRTMSSAFIVEVSVAYNILHQEKMIPSFSLDTTHHFQI